jgi:hypothetical protein
MGRTMRGAARKRDRPTEQQREVVRETEAAKQTGASGRYWRSPPLFWLWRSLLGEVVAAVWRKEVVRVAHFAPCDKRGVIESCGAAGHPRSLSR